MSLPRIMERQVVTAAANETVRWAARRMAEKGTRRLVVTGESNRIVGILSLDQVLELLAAEFEAIAGSWPPKSLTQAVPPRWRRRRRTSTNTAPGSGSTLLDGPEGPWSGPLRCR